MQEIRHCLYPIINSLGEMEYWEVSIAKQDRAFTAMALERNFQMCISWHPLQATSERDAENEIRQSIHRNGQGVNEQEC
ncbi:hypothetical protein [Aureibacillus halotolerans]|uniref:Uncharacterized protein n=1 Tax=Aureibacillus halotolerans TaxID=1508390 RepID=A0A4R6U8P5_9BACI|nr:hypothetical protein [Aureibacillus halotolerans]TDQ42176.1 hypothetical protein EV213_102207 [Aureibacillus halotolerans]